MDPDSDGRVQHCGGVSILANREKNVLGYKVGSTFM